MKLYGTMVAAVTMMLGSLGLGCNSSAVSAPINEVVETVVSAVEENAGATDDAANHFARTSVRGSVRAGFVSPTRRAGVRYAPTRFTTPRYARSYRPASYRYVAPRAVFVPFGPPRARYEVMGRAPSSSHFYVPGYHRYVNGRYTWISGHWDKKINGRTWVGAHYNKSGGRWQFIPGHWA